MLCGSAGSCCQQSLCWQAVTRCAPFAWAGKQVQANSNATEGCTAELELTQHVKYGGELRAHLTLEWLADPPRDFSGEALRPDSVLLRVSAAAHQACV